MAPTKYLRWIGLLLSLVGIGIREVVMFTLLQTVVAEPDLLLAIVPNRAITAGGDTLFYLFAAAPGKR